MKTAKALTVAFFGFLASIATSALCKIAFEADSCMIMADVYIGLAIVLIPASVIIFTTVIIMYVLEGKTENLEEDV